MFNDTPAGKLYWLLSARQSICWEKKKYEENLYIKNSKGYKIQMKELCKIKL